MWLFFQGIMYIVGAIIAWRWDWWNLIPAFVNRCLQLLVFCLGVVWGWYSEKE